MADGFVLVMLAFACAVAGGAIGYSLGRRRDVGAEMRLMHMQASTDAILNAAVDGIITIDEHGRIESVNKAAEGIFGYRAEELIGRNVSTLMPEPDRSQHDSYLRNYLWSGRAKIIGIGREVQGLRKDGTVFPMDLAVGEARIGGRRVFAGTIRDISSRKRAESRLRESEARTRAILDAAVDGIVTIDETGIIRSVNPACERIFGYRAVEMVGRNVSMLMPEPYHGEHDGYIRNYLRTGQARVIGLGREVQGRRKDGSVFPMDLTVGEAALGGGRIFAGFVRVVGESRRQADGNRVVVLIDDEPIVLKGLSLILQSWGYRVLAAATEAEAMEQLAAMEAVPSLILANDRLPDGHTGVEAVARIRGHYAAPIPAVIITGDTAPERLSEAEAGGLPVLHKPVQPSALRQILRETLDPSGLGANSLTE
jgi:PAS domain S-box-containing protein